MDDGLGPYRVHCVGQAGEPVADGDAHVLGAPILDLGQHMRPVLGAFAAVAHPQAQDVPGAVCGDADGHVEGPVGHLDLADLHVDAVSERTA